MSALHLETRKLLGNTGPLQDIVSEFDLENASEAKLLSLFGALASRARRYALAADLLQRSLALEPEQDDVKCQLGYAVSQQGGPAVSEAEEAYAEGCRALEAEQWDEAERSFRVVIRRKPRFAEAHAALGIALTKRRRFEEAEASFRLAVLLEPTLAAVHSDLGLICLQRGKASEAEVHLRQALQLDPEGGETLGRLGTALAQLNKLKEAEAFFQQALKSGPASADTQFGFGALQKKLGNKKEAEAAFREALRLAPKHVEALNQLGMLLESLGRLKEAEDVYREAIAASPDSSEIHSNLGVVYSGQGSFEKAEACYRETLRLKPDSVVGLNNLGNSLRCQARYEEAESCLRQALQLQPKYAEAYNNLGILMVQTGRRKEGVVCYEEALRLKPDYPEAHLNRSLVWLGDGNFEQGWAEYEWRWKGRQLQERKYPAPVWTGQSLEGKTLFLYCEQGLGDAIQFVRYASILRQQAKAVIVECPEPLMDLVKALPGVDQVVTRKQETPAFDCHAALLSVPRFLKTDLTNIPAATPYFHADSERVADWSREFAGLDGFRVGIVWQGNPQHKGDRLRSLPLRQFAALAKTPGVALCSVQKGHGREQLGSQPFTVHDFGGRIQDSMSDTAGLYQHLDLLITIDTSVAHLAGALGLPVWVAVPFAPDWRWLQEREDSPWYPSMRLFRQSKPGAWDDVFERIAQALQTEIANRKPTERSLDAPTTTDGRYQVGMAYLRHGKPAAALPYLETAHADDPKRLDIVNALGATLAKLDRRPDAETQFRKALEMQPDALSVRGNLALCLVEQKKYDEAAVLYRDLMARQPDNVEYAYRLANVCRHKQEWKAAEEAYREILRRKPYHLDALNSLGIMLEEQGKPKEAEEYYRQALKIDPRSSEVYSNLGVVLAAQDRLEDAESAYRESLRLRPDAAAALNNLGNTLRMQHRLDEAESSLRRAIEIQPDYAEAHNNLGVVLIQAGDSKRAVDCYTEALRLKSDYSEARLNRSLAWLGDGDFERGWKEYEYRWRGKNLKLRQLDAPLWDGSPLEGKTILLHPEQGLGDAIQFVRYAALLKERGARVVVECPDPLVELFRSCPGVAQTIKRGEQPGAIDYHAPLLNLPGIFETTLATIPHETPYLTAPAERIDFWARELAGIDGLRVGIVWQGNPQHKGDRFRSVPLHRFGRLAMQGVTLCSLQKGHGRQQLKTKPFALEDFGGRLHDSMSDTASLLMNLDLLITVDTSVAHLAGALGVPVWMATPFAADWRWLRKRSDTLWYPSMELFRQPARDDWDDVFTRLEARLREKTAQHPRTARTIAEPTTAEGCFQLGMSYFRRDQWQQAETRLRQAVELDPKKAEYRNCLGATLAKAGRRAEAEAEFRKVLSEHPDTKSVLGNLGLCCLEQAKFVEAEQVYRDLVRLSPDTADFHFRLAHCLRQQKRPGDAEGVYRAFLAKKPENVDALNSLGILLEEQGKPKEAEAVYRQALVKAPETAEVLSNLGVVLSAQERLGEAEKAYRDAIRIRPESATAFNNLGNLLRKLNRLEESEQALRAAVRLRPDYAEAHNNLGIILVHQDRIDEGVACYHEAIRLKPGYAEAYNNLAIVLADNRRWDEAMTHYEEAIRLRPDYAEAHLNRSLTLLSLGDFENGWREYEWRWQPPLCKINPCADRVWDGKSLKGKTILLRAEQGMGDTIQFVRYATLLKKRGARVLLECHEPLADLMTSCPGVEQAISRGKPIPEFDCQLSLLSVPGLVGTHLDNIPAKVPYLSPPEDRAAYWKEKLSGESGLRVGIVWQGNPGYKGDRNRSIPLSAFDQLAALPGVRLISVQKGPGSEQVGQMPFRVEDFGTQLGKSFADTAGLLVNLDLVISVDTSVAHLAGALGLKVWTAVPYASDWRWLRDREDTPWYPTMRLYRAAAARAWEPVLQRMAEDLRVQIAEGAKPAPERKTRRVTAK